MKYPEPYLIPFLKITDATGTLVSTQDEKGLPFTVQRVFWVYPAGPKTVRGGHAHHTTQEVLTVVTGKVRVVTETAQGKETFDLTSIEQGLYIPPYCWITVHPPAEAILCCMTSSPFIEADYIRDYRQFQAILQEKK